MTVPLFGTDGIRGPAGIGPLAPSSLTRLGLAIARSLAAGSRARAHRRVLVGRDTRVSGPAVLAGLSAGLLAGGLDVEDGGVLPTPAVAMLTRRERFDLGVVVSASHNPWPDNGIKLLGKDGRKLGDEAEASVERTYADPATEAFTHPENFGVATWRGSAAEDYARAILAEWRGTRLSGLTVVVDCGNGAQSGIAAAVLKKLGANVLALSDAPDGRNINSKCGAMHPDVIRKAVREHGASAGVAFDGDADRVQICDEKGRLVDGDAIVAALAPRFLAAGRLPGATVVGTSMSNGGLAALLAGKGIRLLRTAVGDRHIAAEMAARGYGLGAEPSGHVIVPRDGLLTGDGLYAAIACLAVLAKEKIPASKLAAGYRPWPLEIVSVEARERRPIEEMKATSAAIADAEQRLGTSGRIVVRWSGTEPKVRVMVEARRAADLRAALRPVLAALREENRQMITLALDTSGDEATVALVRDEPGRTEVLGAEVLSTGMRHGVELFPALERLLRAASIAPRDVGLVAVGTGPGSYTGLRVGITAARAFAYAASADLLGIPSCDAWAAAAPIDVRPLAVVLDARIKAVYVAVYEAQAGVWTRRSGPELMDPALSAAHIPADAITVGDGVRAYAEAFAVRTAPPETSAGPSRAEASHVARLALGRRARGEHDSIESVVPLYLRRPEAEIKREARIHG